MISKNPPPLRSLILIGLTALIPTLLLIVAFAGSGAVDPPPAEDDVPFKAANVQPMGAPSAPSAQAQPERADSSAAGAQRLSDEDAPPPEVRRVAAPADSVVPAARIERADVRQGLDQLRPLAERCGESLRASGESSVLVKLTLSTQQGQGTFATQPPQEGASSGALAVDACLRDALAQLSYPVQSAGEGRVSLTLPVRAPR